MCEITTDIDDPDAICDKFKEEEPLWEYGYGAASIGQAKRLGLNINALYPGEEDA